VADGVQKLAALQDIDAMIRESQKEEDIGFSTQGLETLQKAREKLAGEIDGRSLRLYERLRKRYDRAVVPVIDHKCVGCQNMVPTGQRRSGEDRTTSTVVVCENCGRILFFV
jgi:predicted  nucleic acid-binding Zn-ribbon protein